MLFSFISKNSKYYHYYRLKLIIFRYLNHVNPASIQNVNTLDLEQVNTYIISGEIIFCLILIQVLV